MKAARKHTAPVSGKILYITRGEQHPLGVPSHFSAEVGEHDVVEPPLDKSDPEVPFKVADLHGQRLLRDRPTEMPVLRKCYKIPQLPEGDHRSIMLIIRIRQSDWILSDTSLVVAMGGEVHASCPFRLEAPGSVGAKEGRTRHTF
jgi:hypothetical protein